MSELPKGWAAATFDDVIYSITNGLNGKQNKDGNGIPVSRIESIASQVVDMSRVGYLDKYDEETLEKYRLQPGDILFSHINSPIHIGKTAICENTISLYHGVNLLRIVLSDAIVPKFFNNYCKFIRARGDFSSNAQHAVNQSSLNQKKIKSFKIVIPPKQEQVRIANKLDSILAKVDKAQARLDKIPAILKRFRQSVLAAATSGELTKHAVYQSGDYYKSLRAEIDSNAKSKKLKPQSESEVTLAHELFDGITWPKWECYPLELLVDPDRGIPYGIVQTGEYQEVGIPTIRCGDVKYLKIKTDALKLVSPEIEEKYVRTRLKGREVLLAIRGTVGNAAVVTDELIDIRANISREVAMIPVRDNIDPHYIALLLQSPGGYRALAEKVRGVAQKGINLADVKRFVTPLPCLEEQGDIVKKVGELFNKANKVEKQYLDAKARLDRLTQSILAKAFRGELVTQDPNDEPAEKLLERIVAEKEQSKPKKTTRKRSTKAKAVEKE